MPDSAPERIATPGDRNAISPVADAAVHGMAWLLIANLIGVWLAFLLLVPSAGGALGSWSYGRWMPVHLNLQLYGWISLPLVAWLFRIYHANSGALARWSRAALVLWSLALTIGSWQWLQGASSGKLFLDWTGYSRVYFPVAILFLWGVLAAGYVRGLHTAAKHRLASVAKAIGLLLLVAVPFAIYAAANPNIYPPVNPDSGGPTAASQLESVLVIVLILFLLPYGLGERTAARHPWMRMAWGTFFVEALLCLGLGRADVSHHAPTQFLSLGSLLVWIPLIPAYYKGFVWERRTRMWRGAVLFWWALLIPTGWTLFLPGVLDRLKFTDGLVSHSLLAMAGFVTSLLILMLSVLLGPDGDTLNSPVAFLLWNVSTLMYVGMMVFAGWIEGGNPSFTMVPSLMRTVLYTLRLFCGIGMSAASAMWLYGLLQRVRVRALAQGEKHARRSAPSSALGAQTA